MLMNSDASVEGETREQEPAAPGGEDRSKEQLLGGVRGLHGALGAVWIKFRGSGSAGTLSELERVQSR